MWPRELNEPAWSRGTMTEAEISGPKQLDKRRNLLLSYCFFSVLGCLVLLSPCIRRWLRHAVIWFLQVQLCCGCLKNPTSHTPWTPHGGCMPPTQISPSSHPINVSGILAKKLRNRSCVWHIYFKGKVSLSESGFLRLFLVWTNTKLLKCFYISIGEMDRPDMVRWMV